jgi:hypothetical protein
VEVATSDEVRDHRRRLAAAGVATLEGSGTCCFAAQDKIWVDAPDGAWEIYTVLDDAPVAASDPCCGTTADAPAPCC